MRITDHQFFEPGAFRDALPTILKAAGRPPEHELEAWTVRAYLLRKGASAASLIYILRHPHSRSDILQKDEDAGRLAMNVGTGPNPDLIKGPQSVGELVPPMFKTSEFRKFAIEALGPQAEKMSIRRALSELETKAVEGWSASRDDYFDTCVVCGWKGQHATVGQWWHVNKRGEYYEHPDRTCKRPNFLDRGDGWVCVHCVKKRFRHHPHSGVRQESSRRG